MEMQKLSIYACENVAPDYEAVIRQEGYADVEVTAFPCLCLDRKRQEDALCLFSGSDTDKCHKIMCGSQCPLLSMKEKIGQSFTINTSNNCYNHILNEKLIAYILYAGSYIVTSGWLANWRHRLEDAGFDQYTAQSFFHDACKEIVLLDTGVDSESKQRVAEFSRYVDIPFQVIEIGLENLRIYLRSLVYEWRMTIDKDKFNDTLLEARKESAEYSAILSIIEQIAGYTRKRDLIGKIKDVFNMVFGVQHFRYIDADTDAVLVREYQEHYFSSQDGSCQVLDKTGMMLIKVEYDEELFGIIEMGDFLFPEQVRKYSNFAQSIARICALVISNTKQYEMLERSRDEVVFVSYHDSLTGLFNRTYFNQFLSDNENVSKMAVFVCDADNLKKVNDQLGHNKGDEMICAIAEVLRKCFRETDVIARIGGDEFAVIVSGCNKELAEGLKVRLNNLAAQSFNNKYPFEAGVSSGYALTKRGEVSLRMLVSEADRSMYQEKMSKKNTSSGLPPVSE